MAASAAPPLPPSDDRADRAFAAWFTALPADPALVRFFDRKVRERERESVCGWGGVGLGAQFLSTRSPLPAGDGGRVWAWPGVGSEGVLLAGAPVTERDDREGAHAFSAPAPALALRTRPLLTQSSTFLSLDSIHPCP